MLLMMWFKASSDHFQVSWAAGKYQKWEKCLTLPRTEVLDLLTIATTMPNEWVPRYLSTEKSWAM
jgi:hypothetical protein